MLKRMVWIATLALAGGIALAGPASAQYRGNGYSNDPSADPYQADPNQRGGPDPFFYPDNRRTPPRDQTYDYDQRSPYDQAPYQQGRSQEPLYVDPRDGGRAAGPASDTDLGETINRRTMVEVENPTKEGPGTIVIDTASRHLYLVEQNGRALQYGIGVGREGFAWKGSAKIERKAAWPDWIPPGDMLKRRPDLPLRMAGGIENPLGARALYLFQGNKDTLFRIHGTNEPDTIGKAVSSGCIRMMNGDVIDLYQRVPVGTKVKVL